MSIESTLAEQIETRLKAYIANPDNDALNLRKLAAQFEALPLCIDWERCWALRPDGRVVVFSHEGGQPDPREEDDPRLVNVALFQGSITYPELKPLVPLRSADAKDCPYCAAGGIEPDRLEEQHIVCYCGGLGWVPETV
jgi:hypothetical protein